MCATYVGDNGRKVSGVKIKDEKETPTPPLKKKKKKKRSKTNCFFSALLRGKRNMCGRGGR
jgi:hypothetical protein